MRSCRSVFPAVLTTEMPKNRESLKKVGEARLNCASMVRKPEEIKRDPDTLRIGYGKGCVLNN